MTVRKGNSGCALSEAVGIAIDNALKSRIEEPKFRVFVNGRLDYSACVRLAREWHPCNGEPHRVLKNILGDQAVLALNQVARWSHEVQRALSASNLAISGVRPGYSLLVDTYVFVSSSSGLTPFGAHVDFEDSLIIDLAGEGRDIRIWDKGACYGAIQDGASGNLGISFDWWRYREGSRIVHLGPNGSFLIPARAPHIFRALGPGFFLGISAVQDSTKELSKDKKVALKCLSGSRVFDPLFDPSDRVIEMLSPDEAIEVGSRLRQRLKRGRVLDTKAFQFSGRTCLLTDSQAVTLERILSENDSIEKLLDDPRLLKKLNKMGIV